VQVKIKRKKEKRYCVAEGMGSPGYGYEWISISNVSLEKIEIWKANRIHNKKEGKGEEGEGEEGGGEEGEEEGRNSHTVHICKP
jgi:hypothetical protein